eukprot:9429940-Pyramimonas_sp.AAC.1
MAAVFSAAVVAVVEWRPDALWPPGGASRGLARSSRWHPDSRRRDCSLALRRRKRPRAGASEIVFWMLLGPFSVRSWGQL